MMWRNKVTDDCVTMFKGYDLPFDFMMEHVLDNLRDKYPENKVFKNRSNKSLVKEWISHNLLYKLYICRERTKDVDFEPNPKWFMSVGYTIGYWLYKILYTFGLVV